MSGSLRFCLRGARGFKSLQVGEVKINKFKKKKKAGIWPEDWTVELSSDSFFFFPQTLDVHNSYVGSHQNLVFGSTPYLEWCFQSPSCVISAYLSPRIRVGVLHTMKMLALVK